MNRPSATPGISRIDQPEKRTRGFFVRVSRRGKIHSAFFTDLKYGGKAEALGAAQLHRAKVLAKLRLPVQKSRRWWGSAAAERLIEYRRRAEDREPARLAAGDLLECNLESGAVCGLSQNVFGKKVWCP